LEQWVNSNIEIGKLVARRQASTADFLRSGRTRIQTALCTAAPRRVDADVL